MASKITPCELSVASHLEPHWLTNSYVLERHLKREEVIMPKKEIGKFRGEPVYRRNNVLSCKTAENWMRIGRRVKERETPMKWVKQRAVTLQKRRAQELSIQESGEAIQQGLYAEHQTEVYRPPPIKDVSYHKVAYIWANHPGRHSAELVRQYRSVRSDYVAGGCSTSSL